MTTQNHQQHDHTNDPTNSDLDADIKYWVALHRVSGLGPVRFHMLERRFGSMELAWRAKPADLKAAGLTSSLVSDIQQIRNSSDPDDLMEQLTRHAITPIHLRSQDYPELLAESPDAPPLIYAQGTLTPQDGNGIAVIGTRAATRYGMQMSETLSRDLASIGITIVSGLALGIDSAAHRATLAVHGRTVAILAGGLDHIYPSENRSLARDIAQNGCLITEYPLGIRPLRDHFPRRNRLISGISRGVVVVEAPMKSGTMHTVKWALEQGREVFAVPGNANSRWSTGTNWLIKQGAKITVSVQDIIEELKAFYPQQSIATTSQERTSTASQIQHAQSDNAPPQPAKPAVVKIEAQNQEEQAIIEALSATSQPIHLDEIARTSGIPVTTISSTLTIMEIRGAVRCIEGTLYELQPADAHIVEPMLMDQNNTTGKIRK